MTPPTASTLRSSAEIDFTPEKALKVGKVVGQKYKNIMVGSEMNPSSRMIKDAMIAGMLSMGANVKDVGVAPAPAIALASGGSDCFVVVGEPDYYGVMSGISIRRPNGSPLSDDEFHNIVTNLDEPIELPEYKSVGTIHACDSVIKSYNQIMGQKFSDIESQVILDCGCGCTSLCAPQILASAGTDITGINTQLDNKYMPRAPGVEKGDLSAVEDIVKSNIGSIGISLNGDGTRLVLIDETGRYVKGEEILALLLLYLKPSSLVIPFNTSSMVDDAFWGNIGEDVITDAKNHDHHSIVRTDNNIESITASMISAGADMGALRDGTFIFPQDTLCPDAIQAALLLAKMSGDNSLSKIISSFPEYIKIKEKVRMNGSYDHFRKNITERLKSINSRNVLAMSGWRVEMPEGWFIIDPSDKDSGYINITAESKDRVYVTTMMEMAKDLVGSSI